MIRRATVKDALQLAEQACLLWPDNTVQQMRESMEALVSREDAACFLAYAGEQVIGFAQCQLRHDYVEGTETTPVGYLEGVYVADGYRQKGIARELLTACERWASGCGCSEFASDCELDNVQSLQFHLNVGFEEANRIICFTKKL